MAQLRIMILFGTRAEVIKMAPIIKLMQQDPETFAPIIVVASKQYQQLHQAMRFFGIDSDFDLNVKSSSEIGMLEQLSQLLHNFQTVISAAQPDMLMVLGDTITTLAASLSAFYNRLPVAHVEAGLRTYDKMNPFPDEMQRHLTDTLSDVFFAPTEQARENLLNEQIADERIFVTGNTIIDTVTQYYDDHYQSQLLASLPDDHEFILLTMGRIENTGLPMERVFRTMRDVIETNPNLELICPVATDSAAFGVATKILSNRDRIHVMPLMDLGDFLNTAARSKFILTDSAGTVEEASVFHKPVLLLRQNTERTEAIKAGTAKIVGTDPTSIQQAVFALLNDKKFYNQMTSGGQLFGDGHAADQIVKIIKREF
ncbi:non-hydrolyzing UDP-N-acetylglucosamine 2-epimerase [uncultured Limosilactobacillus sp.]|uniref:non-hydrolyzing UDP-N-acetylglucosamine 2-epimerase n=1 Tax=uncultured Limosilactobacillus sp. TaxID=2837629 RepID=UPI0025FDD0D2|nr:UDP-N-acetylglucosamine 2-epimerase (non-hydrolyzing) [uncultured Limosilactobacillus sp.]